jgi:hypothetical protein
MKNDSQRSPLRYVGLAVILAWVGALGYYLYTQVPFFSSPPPAAAALKLEDRDEWMGLYQQDRKIGYNHATLKRQGDQYLVQDDMVLRVMLMGKDQETRVSLSGKLGLDFSLRSFRLEALSDFMDLRAEGRVAGNLLKMTAWTAGQEVNQDLPLAQTPVLYTSWVFGERLKQAGIKPGLSLTLPVFEPLTRQTLPVSLQVESEEPIQIAGKSNRTFKVRETFQGQEQFFWVTAGGEVLKEWHASGLSAVRETEDQALHQGWDRAGSVDLITALMVKSNTAIIKPREVSYLRARLLGIKLDNLALVSDRQKLSGEVLEVTREAGIPAQGYRLPLAASFPDRAKDFAPDLAADASVQSDNPEIQAAAREAAGGAEDAAAAARALCEWVSNEVKDSMVVSIPSALEVLQKKRGACKEHAVLYAALARALGLPARIASGVVYSEAQLIEGFYYHAWVEVYLAGPDGENGRWVAVDPTFNQFPADATHLRLVQGGLDQMMALMGVVGQLKIEVESYR